MQKLLITLLFLFSVTRAFADDRSGSYKFSLDLTAVENDQLRVELLVPQINSGEAIYRFPKVIPGTYSVYNFGRFISDFKVYDQAGNELPAERIDVNSWKLASPQNSYRITYKVDDTWDSQDTGKFVFEPAGSNIETDNFVINNHNFFGYFDDMKSANYEITVTKPAGFYGSTSLIPVESNETSDKYIVPSYYELVDSPMMYNKPDTTVIDIAGTQVLISVYSGTGKNTSEQIAGYLDDILLATKDYLGTLPVKKYAFIYYFHKGFSRSGLDGALEHSQSSVYSLPDMQPENIQQFVENTSSHEFFHIITPLNIHSLEIQNFDYNDPKMSKHLWLYEGITEYSSRIVQVKAGLMSIPEFFEDISSKINTSLNYDNTMPFTEMSRNVLDEQVNKQFMNVYMKGALIGMLLDIKLRSLSDGKYGVRDMMHDLSQKYGKENAFNDDELFDVITSMTYPEIRDFFRKYVEGTEPLPYKETLALAGINFYQTRSDQQLSMGSFQLGYNPATKRLFVQTIDDSNNNLKFKKGDEWVKFNGKTIELSTLQEDFEAYWSKAKEGDELTVEVARKDSGGTEKMVKLKGELKNTPVQKKNVLEPDDDASEQQLKIRKSWTEMN
jgi:predicted metalloprotease with PDZ domain